MNNERIKKLVLGAFFIALGIVLPFFTGQIPQVGSALLPMHIPVLLSGIICGPQVGILVGFITPLLRSVTFGMPPMFPVAIAMAFELATYAVVIGLVYQKLEGKKFQIYISLITSMIAGRIAWGLAMFVLMGMAGGKFTFVIFIGGTITGAIPGIILQLVCIPTVIYALKRTKVIKFAKVKG